jgi:three-Cys-motif partner protein
VAKADADHFDSYPPQTQVKHRILTGYLPAYLTALKNLSQRLLYVDGFAGRGKYLEGGIERSGSPLLALELLADDPTLQAKVDLLFIENRADHFSDLMAHVEAFCVAHPNVPKPVLRKGRFAEEYQAAAADRKSGPPPATFLFIDPCGVDGVDMKTIASVLRQPRCELFLFFNSNGIERIGAAAAARGHSPTLDALLGSPTISGKMVEAVIGAKGDIDKEVLAVYQVALRAATGCRYVLPFRVEAPDRRDTSHYLVHACNDCLGFKIMKHVMLDAARASRAESGKLEYAVGSRDSTLSLFGVEVPPAEADVLAKLEMRPFNVGTLIQELVCRPTDFNSEGIYKRLICGLEERGIVGVFEDMACQSSTSRIERMRKNSKTGMREPTLANRLWVRKK